MDVEKLKEETVKEKFTLKVNGLLQEKYKKDAPIEERWNNIKQCLKISSKEVVGYKKHNKKKPWVTSEMLEKMRERRK